MKKFVSAVKEIVEQGKLNVLAARMSIATGAVMLPLASENAAAQGIGQVFIRGKEEVSGIFEFVKLFIAFIGVCMIGYAVWGLTWGKKNDEREFKTGAMIGFMLGGAALTSIGVLTSTMSASIWGQDESVTDGLDL